jgi:hypothetical protein
MGWGFFLHPDPNNVTHAINLIAMPKRPLHIISPPVWSLRWRLSPRSSLRSQRNTRYEDDGGEILGDLEGMTPKRIDHRQPPSIQVVRAPILLVLAFFARR